MCYVKTMLQVYTILYISLFIVTVTGTEYHEEDGSPVEKEDKLLNHYHKTRASPKMYNDEDTESNSSDTEQPPAETKDNDSEKPANYEKPGTVVESTSESETENNFGRSGDAVRNDVSTTDDSVDNYDTEKEIFKVGNTDNEDFEANTDARKESVHTPNRKSLSQDAVLDLKARTGHIDEDDDIGDLNLSDTSKIGHFSNQNSGEYLRSGYVPPDDVDVLKTPDYNLQDLQPTINGGHSLSRPYFSYGNNHIPEFIWPNNARQDGTGIPNSRQRYAPLLYESINSREMFYPRQGSRELMWGHNTGQLTKKYFGLTHPLYNSRSREKCQSCRQKLPLQDRNFRSAEEEHSKKTADGRSVEYDPSGANAYPLVKAYAGAEVTRHQSVQSDEFLTYGSKEVATQVERNDVKSESGSVSKYVLTVPSYIKTSNPLLRRIAVGAGPRYIL